MQKNGEIRAKIGVDTADILILWPSAKIKMKMQNFVLENLHPGLVVRVFQFEDLKCYDSSSKKEIEA